jgi:hypothetical protein
MEKNSSLGGFCTKRHSFLELFHMGGIVFGVIYQMARRMGNKFPLLVVYVFTIGYEGAICALDI